MGLGFCTCFLLPNPNRLNLSPSAAQVGSRRSFDPDHPSTPFWQEAIKPERGHPPPRQMLLGTMAALRLWLLAAALAGTGAAPESWSAIGVSNGGPWGPWAWQEMCPRGTYATGFSLKVLSPLLPQSQVLVEEVDAGGRGGSPGEEAWRGEGVIPGNADRPGQVRES